jgi:hypothetical protein
MQVIINVDVVTPTLEGLIEEVAKEQGIPECLGDMVPPLLGKDISVEDTKVFKVKNSIPTEEWERDDLINFVKSTYDCDNKVLTNKGADHIIKIKRKMAEAYVNKIKKCVTCKYIDVCDKLTKNYMMAAQNNINFSKK